LLYSFSAPFVTEPDKTDVLGWHSHPPLHVTRTQLEHLGRGRHVSDAGIYAFVPPGHNAQYVDATAKIEYSSFPHELHASDPAMGLYLPATQPVQIEFVRVYPALQMQSDIEVLPEIEYVFIGQYKHPLGCMYMPARQ
jgi:hypothetical protein